MVVFEYVYVELFWCFVVVVGMWYVVYVSVLGVGE